MRIVPFILTVRTKRLDGACVRERSLDESIDTGFRCPVPGRLRPRGVCPRRRVWPGGHPTTNPSKGRRSTITIASTRLGDDIFGNIIADLENDAPGRCSHGGPVCLEYANGHVAAFYANTSDHNSDGWSEYALSKDGGRTWDRYNKFEYSHEAYKKDPKRPVIVEEGLTTSGGVIVLFLTHVDNGRSRSGFMRSRDHGASWIPYEPLDGDFVGYPCAVGVAGDTNYVLYDISQRSPRPVREHRRRKEAGARRSTLPLDDDKWYGAMCIMQDGRLLAGAYTEKDEHHLYYCISRDQGRTWTEQRRAYLDKKVRDPELAYLAGKYYLHGRSGQYGEGRDRFVLYQSDDGVNWGSGIIVSGDTRHADGYSHNCIINQYADDTPNELMVQYSIVYDGLDTNTHVFFIKPDPGK